MIGLRLPAWGWILSLPLLQVQMHYVTEDGIKLFAIMIQCFILCMVLLALRYERHFHMGQYPNKSHALSLSNNKFLSTPMHTVDCGSQGC